MTSKQQAKSGKARVHETTADAAKRTQDKGDELKADLDSLLDEIDDVLEENASEVLTNYRQLGGE